MAAILKFPTLPQVREQVADVMAQDSAWENYQKARKAFAEAQERNRRTAELMAWYKRHPDDNGPEAA